MPFGCEFLLEMGIMRQPPWITPQWCPQTRPRGIVHINLAGVLSIPWFDSFLGFNLWAVSYFFWLVVKQTPLKNMSSSIGMMTFPIVMGKSTSHVPGKPPTSYGSLLSIAGSAPLRYWWKNGDMVDGDLRVSTMSVWQFWPKMWRSDFQLTRVLLWLLSFKHMQSTIH